MKINKEEVQPGDFWVSTSHGMSGWFAVFMWLNPGDDDLGPFAEPWDTGVGRYATKDEAIEEAQAWAVIENLPYIPE